MHCRSTTQNAIMISFFMSCAIYKAGLGPFILKEVSCRLARLMSFRHSWRVFQYCETYLAPGRTATALPTPRRCRQIPCDRLCNRSWALYTPRTLSILRARGKRASGEEKNVCILCFLELFGIVVNHIRQSYVSLRGQLEKNTWDVVIFCVFYIVGTEIPQRLGNHAFSSPENDTWVYEVVAGMKILSFSLLLIRPLK